MEKLAQIIANKISSELSFDEEKKEVITYGLIAIIQGIITIFLISVIGIIFGTLIEALLICLSVSLLRKYSGGAHASSIEICTALSVVYCTVFSILCKYILVSLLSTNILIVILITVFFISFFAIYKLAPVDSPNKPIKTEKKKARMRKGSYFILTVYLIISFAFLLLGLRYNNFNSYFLSIIFGISWQVFTLTQVVHSIYNKFDFILHKIN
jgi:accessory gene regulator B